MTTQSTQRLTQDEFVAKLYAKFTEKLNSSFAESYRKSSRDLLISWSQESGKSIEEHAVISLSPSRFTIITFLLEMIENDFDRWITIEDYHKAFYKATIANRLQAEYDIHPDDLELAEWQIESDLGWLMELAGEEILEFDPEHGFRFAEFGRSILPYLSSYNS